MAFVSRKRVGSMGGRRWIRSFARPAVAVVAAMREEQRRQAGRVVSRGGRGGGEESEVRLQRRLVRGRLEQGRRRRRRRAEEGDAGFCEGFCEEMGPAVLLPRNEHPVLRIAFTPCGFSYFQGGGTELSKYCAEISGGKFQLRQNIERVRGVGL